MLQGRLVEAEVNARQVLLNRLKAVGKFNPEIPNFLSLLGEILTEQGRHAESEKLIRASLDIYETLGVSHEATGYLRDERRLAITLGLENRWSDSAKIFDDIDVITENWEPTLRNQFRLDPIRIVARYRIGDFAGGLTLAQELLQTSQTRFGAHHFAVAMARGYVAIGLTNTGQHVAALREFRTAIPVLRSQLPSDDETDDGAQTAVRVEQLRNVVEAYVALLAKERAKGLGTAEIDNESFQLVEFIRGSTVKMALAASGARFVANDPVLASLVREEQDLGIKISAQLGLLSNALALPPGDRDDTAVKKLRDQIERMRGERKFTQRQIEREFPEYAALVNPKPPTIADVRNVLRADEAVLSFYFGREASFVWAIPKNGELSFAVIPTTSERIEAQIRKLREALEPKVAMISDIPAFDVKLALELYHSLLKPVEDGWKPAKNLIVVTNGALGLLPLSLLPTAPTVLDANDDPLFANYRKVPWLARTHAVTLVPSASTLQTLRKLPPGKPSRQDIIAFGDPYFSKDQADEAAKDDELAQVADASSIMSGLPLKRRNSPQLEGADTAQLAQLPRLPDTADELKSIALALQANPATVLNLGKDANEQKVKTMDLSGFKIIAFATHGLVPGELDGLTQPALALSAPDVADTDGDGLLIMEEILALKLDADWVLLSACNTGAGAGVGAEAASGLGRAFFYAGTRALLVTNWSVHSQSARELVTDLFKRQVDDAKLTRGEALRTAMMALADGPGYIGADGKTEFAYAHPLFWAPYSIIGDGGGR